MRKKFKLLAALSPSPWGKAGMGLLIAVIAPLLSFASPGLITGSAGGCIGSTWTLADTTAGGIWYSTDTYIATVDSFTGAVTGIRAGSVNIVYYLSSSSYEVKTVTIVADTVPDTVYIVTTTPVVPGTTDTFIAVPVNGGSAPAYEWFINSVADPLLRDTLINPISYGDVICVVMTPSLACAPETQTCIVDTLRATTGISRGLSEEATVRVFPNPAQNNITVQYDFAEDGAMQITDMMGRAVLTKKLSSADKEEQIDVSSLSPGLYFYKVEQNNVFIATGKIMKE